MHYPLSPYQEPIFHHVQWASKLTIYVFTDAAYGAVVYLNKADQICLAMSKSHVAPVKTITLSKLKLMAAVIGTRLAKFSIVYHSHEDSPIRIHFWTDSQIVLH